MRQKAASSLTLQQCHIRDVQGGTVAPSSSSELTGIAVQ
ncbi:hypothetical protein DRB03_26830 (plasmid) [Klebsiella pneumoniae]|nr:hypothetical protein DRB03_26830 [Klebsiella pneumoniae]